MANWPIAFGSVVRQFSLVGACGGGSPHLKARRETWRYAGEPQGLTIRFKGTPSMT